MTIFSPQYFDLLKNNVLKVSGLTSVTPCDCRTISVLAFNKTKFSLSETTLKRVYGFAYSKFKPSLFTIDVMAKYCGYAGWDDFCEKQGGQIVKSTESDTSWETLRQQADKITNFTLQALKNKSGIPYNLTVKRQFINNHFHAFLDQGLAATAFCAPAGYGKTLALCHWIEDRLAGRVRGENNDIILFFSSSALMNVFLSGRNLNEWILGLLGYTSDEHIASLIDVTQRKAGNFYLILDGLDEHAYKPDQFQLLVNQIMDIFSLYTNTTWFKLVLTMRSATWMNNMHDLKNNDKWFDGVITDTSGLYVNVPLFSIHEIKTLCQNINPRIQNFIGSDLSESFNHPLYFQFYYKEHKDNFSLNNIDRVCLHELISTFILNKVYLGQNSCDKQLLLSALVNEMDFEKEHFDIPKPKVNALIKQYYNAYQELISVGFIRELNNSSDLQYNTSIQFGNSNFLQYTIAKSLLVNNNFIFDDKLIATINNQFNNKHKLSILKWSIIYAFKTGQQNNFTRITAAKLTPYEKSELLLFLGDLLEKSRSGANNLESSIQYFKNDDNDQLFNYFFGMEFISADYKKTLLTLLKFELSDHKKILIYTGLATIAILQLDIALIGEYLTKLESFPQHNFRKFAINPAGCIDTVYQYFREGTIKKEFFEEVTRFYFNPDIHKGVLSNQKANEVVYILAGFALVIAKNPNKILRFSKALNHVYKPNADIAQSYRFFMQIVEAQAYSALRNMKKVSQMYNSITAVYKEEEKSYTVFMKSLYYAVKIKKAILTNDYDHIPGYLKYMTNVSAVIGNKLSRTFIYQVILLNDQIMNINPQFYKQVQYDLNKVLRETGLNTEAFNWSEVVRQD
jgi:hypothetical protein